MQRHPEHTRNRIRLLADVLKSKIYKKKLYVDELLVSTAVDRITYEEAQKLKYRPVKLGEHFGPLWSTFWFRGSFTVPSEWSSERIDLIWIAHYCESTLWIDHSVVQGLNYSFGERTEAVISKKAKAGQKIEFQIEMACNTVYGQWPAEKPYLHASPYVLDQVEVGIFDAQAQKIFFDFLVLQQLEADIASFGNSGDIAFGAHILSELNRFANKYDPEDTKTWTTAHSILIDLYKSHNGSHVHELSAVGEGHLDIAWWWPVAETWRKIIRTAANQIALMDSYPKYHFVCSQACVYDKLKERQPELYKRVKEKVTKGQWIPVGGTWVEPDCNLPTGESLVRQFLFGQEFFQQEFGFRAQECWLQDAFGFNGQLPQIMKLAGIKRFVTQKLLWSEPKPPHRLFSWEGIDGSKVLAHFPSNKTFSRELTVGAIRKIAREYPDDDYSPRSLMTYGWGDGGGGPTPLMVETISRLADLQSVPHTVMRSPAEYFALVEQDLGNQRLLTWVGELYFCRHRGTFTSQAATKKAMHQAEIVLHELEFLSAIAFKLGIQKYPQAKINELWKTVLLNQFHDILPGTSITMVHDEAVKQLEGVKQEAKNLCDNAASIILNTKFIDGVTGSKNNLMAHKSAVSSSSAAADKKAVAVMQTPTVKEETAQLVPFNTTPFSRNETAEMPDGSLVYIEAPSYGIGHIIKKDEKNGQSLAVTVSDLKKHLILENENLIAEFNSAGDLLRLFEKQTKREVLSAPANQLEIYDDNPVDYDAWEIEHFYMETKKNCPPAQSYKVQGNDWRAEIIFERKIGLHSSMKQIVRLEVGSQRLEFYCEVDWQEEHKLLKVLFPVAVNSTFATYETQFGAIERPTHYNMPYDQARFEVPAQRWADLSEYGFGVALLSNAKYGFSVYSNEMRLSLLRAPKSPDPKADMGKHQFSYALMPHKGGWQEGKVVAEASKFNSPVIWTTQAQEDGRGLASSVQSFAHVDDQNLVLDTIKKAEKSDALILRLYECHGARGTAQLNLALPFTAVKLSNILEDDGESVKVSDGHIILSYRPFEIITLKVI